MDGAGYDPLEPFERRRSWSRALSLTVVLLYLVAAIAADKPWLLVKVVLPAVIPMLCIWYPDAMTSISSSALGWRESTYSPPAGLLRALAWIALLAPIWVLALVMLASK